MARTALTLQQIGRTGLQATFAAAVASGAGGNMFANNGRTFLQVKNGSGAPVTVTINIPVTVAGSVVASKTVTVAMTSGDKMIGPFEPGIYNQPDGNVYWDCGADATSITAAAFSL